LDYPEDYELFKQIFEELYNEGEIFSFEEIMKLFKDKPELLEINKDRVQIKAPPLKFKK